MPTISVRRLPEHVHASLRLRAARSKRSMEAEVRAILIETCSEVDGLAGPEEVQDWVAALYANQPPKGVADELIAERRRDAERE